MSGSLGGFSLALLVTAAAVLVLMMITFAVALAVGRHGVVDTVWGLGFALVAVVALATSAGHGDAGRRVLLAVTTVAWGVRLAAHIGRGVAGRVRTRATPRCWPRRPAVRRPTRSGRST
jgi:steroid 5-alpha reductase family enzyme